VERHAGEFHGWLDYTTFLKKKSMENCNIYFYSFLEETEREKGYNIIFYFNTWENWKMKSNRMHGTTTTDGLLQPA
jgi:GH25 family lysozyme M1 (1,4-beta-N-acetylmuramidase)